MQDRFKFRIWNKLANMMTYNFMIGNYMQISKADYVKKNWVGINYEPEYICFDNEAIENLEIMQCTGLKDKNGKLIYEGDILALQQFKDDNVVHICFWNEETAEYLYEPIIKGDKEAPLLGIEEFAQTTEYMFEDKNDIPVVIGNIYENPELSKGITYD